jgi:hypothetical protein
MTVQLTFDIDSMIHAVDIETAEAWSGAPLHFHSEYYSPNDLDDAFSRWIFENRRLGSFTQSHMWHSSLHPQPTAARASHALFLLYADLRCNGHNGPQSPSPCSCIGDLMYQAICPKCSWQAIDTSENLVVEAWHDHAWPGWTHLPIIPGGIRPMGGAISQRTTRAYAWIVANYPTQWQRDGAPIRTRRSNHSMRHVPGYSPWNGYDLSAPQQHQSGADTAGTTDTTMNSE